MADPTVGPVATFVAFTGLGGKTFTVQELFGISPATAAQRKAIADREARAEARKKQIETETIGRTTQIIGSGFVAPRPRPPVPRVPPVSAPPVTPPPAAPPPVAAPTPFPQFPRAPVDVGKRSIFAILRASPIIRILSGIVLGVTLLGEVSKIFGPPISSRRARERQAEKELEKTKERLRKRAREVAEAMEIGKISAPAPEKISEISPKISEARREISEISAPKIDPVIARARLEEVQVKARRRVATQPATRTTVRTRFPAEIVIPVLRPSVRPRVRAPVRGRTQRLDPTARTPLDRFQQQRATVPTSLAQNLGVRDAQGKCVCKCKRKKKRKTPRKLCREGFFRQSMFDEQFITWRFAPCKE